MEPLFKKNDFPEPPDGDRYKWEEVKTSFEVKKAGKYVIAITASAKNAKQNRSTAIGSEAQSRRDDDDLRVAIDGYEFGKYEVHDEKVSWKGFGTSASWDGASLKGGTKTVYFFLEFTKGEHELEFYADKTPELKEVTVFALDSGQLFKVEESNPPETIETDKKGIPWMSFVFFGLKPEKFSITSIAQSATQKNSTDGDNLKVVANGKIQQNIKALTSDKYKNFYFSGDLNQGESETLEFASDEFEFLEDSVEIWYDKSPSIEVGIKIHKNFENWLAKTANSMRRAYYRSFSYGVLVLFKSFGWHHAGDFMKNALASKPENKDFNENSSLAKIIKRDKAYQKVINIIKTQIKNSTLEGQVVFGDKAKGLYVVFEDSSDLKYSLHGLHKVDFYAKRKIASEYEVNFTIYDVYDFAKVTYKLKEIHKIPYVFVNNQINTAEITGIVHSFEIQVTFNEIIVL